MPTRYFPFPVQPPIRSTTLHSLHSAILKSHRFQGKARSVNPKEKGRHAVHPSARLLFPVLYPAAHPAQNQMWCGDQNANPKEKGRHTIPPSARFLFPVPHPAAHPAQNRMRWLFAGVHNPAGSRSQCCVREHQNFLKALTLEIWRLYWQRCRRRTGEDGWES